MVRSCAVVILGVITAIALMGAGTGRGSTGLDVVQTWVTSQGTLAHRYGGCGGETTTVTPIPGHGPLTAKELGLPGAAEPMLRQIASDDDTWVPDTRCTSLRSHTTPQPPVASSVASYTATSPNWSGYRAPVSHPHYARAYWTVPRIVGYPNFNAYSSIWPGIGFGNSTNELVQDGTEEDVTCVKAYGRCQAYSRPVFFWFELFPKESQQEISLSVSAGDYVEVATSWWNGKATFVMCNHTRGTCWNGSQPSPTPPTYYAEWIVERTTESGGPAPLADYSGVWLSHDLYDTGGSMHVPSTGEAYGMNMVYCNETLSSVGALYDSGSTFKATWHHYC